MRIPLFGLLVLLFGVAGLVTFGAAAVTASRQPRQTLLAIACALAVVATLVHPFVVFLLTIRPVATRLSYELVGPLQAVANCGQLLVTAAFGVLAAVGTLRLRNRP